MYAGSHHSKNFECEQCGYSGFHYLGEFKNTDPKDMTKVCADCGFIHTNPLLRIIAEVALTS